MVSTFAALPDQLGWVESAARACVRCRDLVDGEEGGAVVHDGVEAVEEVDNGHGLDGGGELGEALDVGEEDGDVVEGLGGHGPACGQVGGHLGREHLVQQGEVHLSLPFETVAQILEADRLLPRLLFPCKGLLLLALCLGQFRGCHIASEAPRMDKSATIVRVH